jgi:hypothetical protein
VGEGSNHDSGPVFILVPPGPPYSSRLLNHILKKHIISLVAFLVFGTLAVKRFRGQRP